MSNVFFITFIPDDYHGDPEIKDFDSTGKFTIPTQEQVYNAWKRAGYNEYSYNDYETNDENVARSLFIDYGDSEIYYSAYLVVFTNGQTIGNSLVMELSDLKYNEKFTRMTPEDFCEWATKRIKGISIMVPLQP